MQETFAARARRGESVVGYWVLMDSPLSTERIARLGYDYVALDVQHGFLDHSAVVRAAMAVDAASRGSDSAAAVLVRVAANEPAGIGHALDAGASGVIVPMIDDAEQAAAAVAACRYPPGGIRSYGPMRSGLRIGPEPAVADAATLCLVMIETQRGLANLDEIAATPGLDGLYIGPSDLRLAVGGTSVTDESAADALEAAVMAVREAAHRHGLITGIHTPDGDTAARRRRDGFTLVSIASDLVHLERSAAWHLDRGTSTLTETDLP